MKIFLIIIISYLIGCFSSAYFIGRIFKKIDIRSHGSGNAGATNALRVMGLGLGGLTFVFDILKGILAALIGNYILGVNGAIIGGLFAVIGHNWPVFIKFKGGKGVATSIGVLLVLNWKVCLLAALIGIIVVAISRYVSLGSLFFLTSVPIIYILLESKLNQAYFLLTIILAGLSFFRHRENIKRLIAGNENKLGR